jgi:hypothetical protein
VTAEADGGLTEASNLITLCSRCHNEWHYIAESGDGIVFNEWLQWPPAYVIIRTLLTITADVAESTSVTDMCKVMKAMTKEVTTA